MKFLFQDCKRLKALTSSRGLGKAAKVLPRRQVADSVIADNSPFKGFTQSWMGRAGKKIKEELKED